MLRTSLSTFALICGGALAGPSQTSPPPFTPAAAPVAAQPAATTKAPATKPASPAPAAKPAAAPQAKAEPPAPQPARVARTTDLRATPASDGALLRVVPANLMVEVAERQGGWYRVTVEGAAGWMRLSAVRFANSAGGPAPTGSNSPLRFLQSGRSAVTTGTVTTGVRGLSEEGLAKAVPDHAAVAALDPLAVSGEDARRFAADGQLAATSLAYIPAPKADKKKSKKSRKRDKDGGP